MHETSQFHPFVRTILFLAMVASLVGCGSDPFPCGATELLTADNRCVAASQPNTYIDNSFKCARDEVQTSDGQCKPAEQDFPCASHKVLNERGDCLDIPTYGVISTTFLAEGRGRKVAAGTTNILFGRTEFRAVTPMVYTISDLTFEMQPIASTKRGGVMPSEWVSSCDLKTDDGTPLDSSEVFESTVDFSLNHDFTDVVVFWIICNTKNPPAEAYGNRAEIATDLTGAVVTNSNQSSTTVVFAARNIMDTLDDYRDSVIIERTVSQP